MYACINFIEMYLDLFNLSILFQNIIFGLTIFLFINLKDFISKAWNKKWNLVKHD